MSTVTVSEQIAERCTRLGLSLGWVEPTFDVDEAADLARLADEVARRDDCPATRRVIDALALPAL
jgi:hypothetical protein